MRRTRALGIGDRASSSPVFAFGCGHDGLHAHGKSAVVVAGFEMRGDLFFNNSLAQRIGQNAFETITNLQIHFAILNEHEENRAVVFDFLPDAPPPRHADRVIFNGRIRLHLRVDGNDDLLGSLALEFLELLVQLRRDLRRDDVRVIIEVLRRRLRDDFSGQGREATAETDQNGTQVRH